MRGLYAEGNLCFKINWASLIVGSMLDYQPLFGKMTPHSSPLFGEDQDWTRETAEIEPKLEVNLLFLLCFTLHLRATFQVQAPWGLINYWRGDLCYQFGGLIFEGAYTWRGLFSEFYGMKG